MLKQDFTSACKPAACIQSWQQAWQTARMHSLDALSAVPQANGVMVHLASTLLEGLIMIVSTEHANITATGLLQLRHSNYGS